MELFFEERDQAFPVLLRALKHADRDLKWEIMCVLGTLAKEEFAWPLYRMMVDPSEKDEVRHDAAIQLSVIGPLLKDPKPLADRLLEEIEISEQTLVVLGKDKPDFERKYPTAKKTLGRLADLEKCGVCGDPAGVIESLREKNKKGVTLFTMMFSDMPQDDFLATLQVFANEVMPAFRYRL